LLAEAPEAWPSWAFENHDEPRSIDRWGAGRPPMRWAKTLIALLTTLRGTAFIYQGQELALTQANLPRDALRDPDGIEFWPTYKGRDGCRTPMPWCSEPPNAGFSAAPPWLPVPAEHLSLSVAVQEADPESPLHFVRRFLGWRRQQRCLITGDITFLAAPDPLLVFTRGTGADGFTLVFNLGTKAASLQGRDQAVAFELGATRSPHGWDVPPACGIILHGV
jgi:alpha-glucosidase